MAPAGYHDPVLEIDIIRVNTLTVCHSNDKDISCGHLALMITGALRVIKAPAHTSRLLYGSEPPGSPAKAVFLLISCHCGEK